MFDKFCANQIINPDGSFSCICKINEGKEANCPYSRQNLVVIEGKTVPRINPHNGGNDSCHCFEPEAGANLCLSEIWIG